MARGRFGLKLSWRDLRPRFDLLRRMLRVSVPAGLDGFSIVAGQFWFVALVWVACGPEDGQVGVGPEMERALRFLTES